jgi:hypothetical protein
LTAATAIAIFLGVKEPVSIIARSFETMDDPLSAQQR